MSAFLGPIHFWLYRKITLQQEIVEDIIKLSELKIEDFSIREELDLKYGINETGKLENIIDESNIHGWLQSRVSQTENKLAYIIKKVLDKDTNLLKDIETIFYNKGVENSFSNEDTNLSTIYKELSDCLLDGMPCDRAYSVVGQDEDEVTLSRNVCVHKEYWDLVGGDIKTYYQLREQFIRGFLSSTDVVYETIDETTHVMKRNKKG